MKHVSFCVFFLSLLAFSCSPSGKGTDSGSAADSPAQAVPVDLPTSFYKKLAGTIGDIPVTMDLMRRDSVLCGRYSYDKVGLPISVNGTIAGDNTFSMGEYVGQGEETGSFKGHFSTADAIEGEWVNAANHKILHFQLRQVTEGAARIECTHFNEENCDTRDRTLKEGGVDENYMTDTLCSYIDVSSIVVKTGDGKIDELIENALLTEICSASTAATPEEPSKAYPSMMAYLNSVQHLEEDEYLSRDQVVDVVTNEKGVLCLNVGGYEYGGGAHGFGWVNYMNFDLESGKVLELKDLLVPNYDARLNEIATRIFFGIAENDGLLFDEDPNNFKLNDNFAITGGGLIFTFNPYEIAPYVAGMPEVTIPYKDMKALIPAGGILSKMQVK